MLEAGTFAALSKLPTPGNILCKGTGPSTYEQVQALMMIANASTTFNHQPSAAKIAIIKPLQIREGKAHNDPRSYRPVSLLPVVERIVKSLKAKQMQVYRETLEIIPPEMHGYRSNMGKTTALLEM